MAAVLFFAAAISAQQNVPTAHGWRSVSTSITIGLPSLKAGF